MRPRPWSTPGWRRVVFAQADPTPVAAGGAETLRAAGVDVEGGLLADEARAVNRAWSFAAAAGRPFVTWKLATTLDGRSAAADGTSRWVSSRPARRDTHRLRAECDAIMVGTGTVLVDDPQLTVRDEDDENLPRERQLLRVVMGTREVPATRRVLDGAAETLVLATRDPQEALAALFARDVRHLFLEGGPTLAPRSSVPASSTRWSRTSPRCCSARAAAPSATSASAPSPTRCTSTSSTSPPSAAAPRPTCG